jgi:hypothetical protein
VRFVDFEHADTAFAKDDEVRFALDASSDDDGSGACITPM